MDDSTHSTELSVCVLASGSKGNAIYVAGQGAALLFDAGLSGREIERRMRTRQLEPTSLTGIVVSHEHSDHIKGVGVLSRRYKLPVYITPETGRQAAGKMGRLHQTNHFACDRMFEIDGLKIRPFALSHDARNPVGFTISDNRHKVGVATDLGVTTQLVKEHLQGCHLLIMEANHDMEMLINGPYPWYLKQRIKGRNGHLSNVDAGELLEVLWHRHLHTVILAHLSEKNNHPEKALEVVSQAVASSPSKPEFHVANQDLSSKVIVLR